jgi:hypothetical protein
VEQINISLTKDSRIAIAIIIIIFVLASIDADYLLNTYNCESKGGVVSREYGCIIPGNSSNKQIRCALCTIDCKYIEGVWTKQLNKT